MKFGQLMLNGGTWEGRRILSRDFVDHATAPLYHLANIYYGYNWWSEDFPYKSRTVHAVMALGAGGQIVTVVPELDLVIAFYAGNYSSRVSATSDTSTSRDTSCRRCGKRETTRTRRLLNGITPVRMATRRTGVECRSHLRSSDRQAVEVPAFSWPAPHVGCRTCEVAAAAFGPLGPSARSDSIARRSRPGRPP